MLRSATSLAAVAFISTLYCAHLYGQTTVQPSNARAKTVSITEYGAVPDGKTDSTIAIRSTIEAARLRGLGVYVPSGTFVRKSFSLDSVTMAGSGPDSILLAPNPKDSTIFLRHSQAGLRNLTVKVVSTHRDAVNYAIWIDHASQFEVASVTVEGANSAGIYNSGGSNGRIVRNVVLNTLSDGIHNTNGAHDIEVAENTIRHSGDDMIAIVSYAKEDFCYNILIKANDLANQNWGRSISVVGGRDVTIEGNKVTMTNCCAGIYMASETSWKTHSVWNVVARDNLLTDNSGSTGHGAVMLFADQGSIRNILLERNTIIRPRHSAIRLQGNVDKVALINNQILDAQESVIAEPKPIVCGSGNTFDAVAITLPPCNAPSALVATGSAISSSVGAVQ